MALAQTADTVVMGWRLESMLLGRNPLNRPLVSLRLRSFLPGPLAFRRRRCMISSGFEHALERRVRCGVGL